MYRRIVPPVQPNTRIKRFRKVHLLAILMVVFVAFSVLQFYENQKTIALMKDKVYELQVGIQHMKSENERLASILKQMDRGDYIERIAREELGLVRRGEILVITVEEKVRN